MPALDLLTEPMWKKSCAWPWAAWTAMIFDPWRQFSAMADERRGGSRGVAWIQALRGGAV